MIAAILLCDPDNPFLICGIDCGNFLILFGPYRALMSLQLSTGETVITLRITTHEAPESIRLKLEGRLTGPWVREFDQTWRTLERSLGSRKLIIDLCGVIHMDAEAQTLLAEIYEKTGAELVADTPMTKYFADQARLQSRTIRGGK